MFYRKETTDEGAVSGVSFLHFALSCAAQTSRVAGAIREHCDQTGSAVAWCDSDDAQSGTSRTRTCQSNSEGSFLLVSFRGPV